MGAELPSLVSSVKDETPKSNRKPLIYFNSSENPRKYDSMLPPLSTLQKRPPPLFFFQESWHYTYFQILFALIQVPISIKENSTETCSPVDLKQSSFRLLFSTLRKGLGKGGKMAEE